MFMRTLRDYRTWPLLALVLIAAVALATSSGSPLSTVGASTSQFGAPPERLEQPPRNPGARSASPLAVDTAQTAGLQGDRAFGIAALMLASVFGLTLFRLAVSEEQVRRTTAADRHPVNSRLSMDIERDPETDTLNRRGLERWLPALLTCAQSRDGSTDQVVLACLDLDGFKSINDLWGHTTSGRVVRAVSGRLEDLTHDGVHLELCHFESDQFVLFATTEARSTAWLTELGDRLVEVVGTEVRLDGRTHHVTASVGIASSTRDSTVDSLLLEAQSALITAKKQRGRSVVYNREVSRTGELVHALPLALAAHEIIAHIQPVIDVRDHRIAHVEALARWNRASGEQVPPSVFVPLAESYGLAEELTTTVLQSVREIMTIDSMPDEVRVWVNVSPHELDVKNFAQRFLALLHTVGVSPGRIGLEITETAAVSDPQRLGIELATLRAKGVGLAIDDFGNGYTPLGYLRLLPVDTVKLDRSLISHIDTNTGNQHMVAGIVGLVHELGMTITAEGVEREEEKQWLLDHGVFRMQGFLFAHPGKLEGRIGSNDITMTMRERPPPALLSQGFNWVSEYPSN